MEYYVRIPWKIVNQGARNKLFGNKKTDDKEETFDEIIEKDSNKKTRYLNLRIKGTMDDYDIKMMKKKKENK